MILALPLAWLQLSKEKLRLLVAVAGVAFAVVLIFMQLGFRNALFESSTRLHEALAGDLFLISPQFDFVAQPKSFSRRRLFQALGFPGVEAARPLYLGLALWKNPETGKSRTIFAVGVDPSDNAVSLPGVNEQLGLIRKRDVVLYDRAGRPEFGNVAAPIDAGKPFSTEVNNRNVTVGGLFEMGTSFGVDGTVLTSETNFLRLFPARDRGTIDIGVIRLQAGADAVATRDMLRAAFPNDVLVLTRGEYIHREQDYWDTSTPIGYVFTFGVIMGLVVGAIIVYQILFADVSDHLAEYATLKAMGYPNSYLFGVVFQEAVILAVLGYLPGMLISLGLYRLTADATKLPMEMTIPLAVSVVLLAVIMCCVSGAIALRKIRSADPAEIF
jgi:heterocyst specific transport system permease protein